MASFEYYPTGKEGSGVVRVLPFSFNIGYRLFLFILVQDCVSFVSIYSCARLCHCDSPLTLLGSTGSTRTTLKFHLS